MKNDRRNASIVFLILGIIFLASGINAGKAIFLWVGITCIVILSIANIPWIKSKSTTKVTRRPFHSEAETRIIDPKKISTESELGILLMELGFNPKPAQFKNVIVMREVSEKFTDEPCLWLIGQENDLGSHCVIAVENDALNIYCYDEPNDLFRAWEKFTQAISAKQLIDTIEQSTTVELVQKYLYE